MEALATYTLQARLGATARVSDPSAGDGIHQPAAMDGALGSYYRALSVGSEPQILFLLHRQPPGPTELTRLQQTFELQTAVARVFASDGEPRVLPPLAIVQGELRVGLSLAHVEGEPLTALLHGQPLAPQRALRVAIHLSEILAELHRRAWRFGLCSPEHLLLRRGDPPAGAGDEGRGDEENLVVLSLIGARPLGSAAPSAGAELGPAELPYAAPEQLTGGSLSESADLYSLGVLLYQMLGGALPYDHRDPAALVHAHLARRPPSLAERVSGLPPMLAPIVDRLLQKVPSARYLTALGLRADLLRVAQTLSAGAAAEFELGSQDQRQSLSQSLSLDARPEEDQALQAVLAAARGGQTQVVVLSGESGSGKTLVPQRLAGPVRAAGGIFVEVHCEPADQTPHAALAKTLRDLTRQLLHEPAERLSRLQRDLAQNLGPGARALALLAPEIDVLLAGVAPAPPLEGGPAFNRLRFLLSQFLRTVAKPERPVVLLVDDAQWVDAGSLRLWVDSLCASPRLPLVSVMARRSGENNVSQPLAAVLPVLQALRAAGVGVTEREFRPLSATQLRDLFVRSLGLTEAEAAPLADVLHVKSQGNLLGLSQLLRTLQDDGLLRQDPVSPRWVYDLERILGHSAGADAQPVLVQRIARLSEAAQRTLALAACLGPEFTPADLVSLGGAKQPTVAGLDELLASGLVHALGDAAAASAGARRERYRFLHSSVRQAAAALLSSEEGAQIHLRLGEGALSSDPAALPDSQLMFAVQQLNLGAMQLTDSAARRRVAELNLLAGRRAKAATGHEAAAEFFRAGLALLPELTPSDPPTAVADPDLRTLRALELQLQRELTESEYLCGRLPAADARVDALLARVESGLDRAQLLALRIRHYLPAARYRDAVQVGLQAFALLGVEFPSDDAELQRWADAKLAALGPKLQQRGLDALLAQPVSSDPAHRLRLGMVGLLLPPSFASRPSLFGALVAYALDAVLEHGNTEESCIAFFSYALLQVTTGDIERGMEFSELAVRLYQRLNVHRTAGMSLHVHGGHINHWARPLHTSVPILAQSIQVSMAVGDLNHIGNGVFEMVWLLYERGDRLDEVERYAVHALDLAAQIRNEAIRSAVLSCQTFVRCLRAEETGDDALPTERFLSETTAALARLTQASFGPGIGTYHTLHLVLRYLFGQYAEAYAAAQAAMPLLRQVQSLPIEVALHLFRGLTVVHKLAGGDESPELAAQLDQDLAKLSRWAGACPENYAPLYALLRAEIARIRKDPLSAEELYDAAIEGARRSSFDHYAALAHELAARFYAGRGRRLIASAYFRAAYVGYAMWGAQSKARQLATEHPELLTEGLVGEGTTQPSPLRETLDVAAVVRIGQAIAGELRLEQLVEQLLRVALHHAGATRAALLLRQAGGLQLWAHTQSSPEGEVAVQSGHGQPLEQTQEVPRTLVAEVAERGQLRVLADASSDVLLGSDACVLRYQSRSVMALPLLHRSHVSGVLYLENNLSPDVFAGERMQVLGSLCAQAATAVENAQLYTRLTETSAELRRANEHLEREVAQRTTELQRSNQQLAQELARRGETEQARAALQEEVIRMQSQQLAELSTPLVPVAESIMVMPLLGTIDRQRAQDIVEAVLQEAQTSRARVVIIDITGLRRVDDVAVSLLLRAPRALRLLGSQTVLTGMRPDVARAMVAMGADLSSLQTRANLRSGIAYATELVQAMTRR